MRDLYRETMTSVDAAWLGMDRPTNLMVINGLMIFETPIAYDRLHSVLDTRLTKRFRRFRQRVVASSLGAGRYAWQDDPHFNLNFHLRRIALPAPGDDASLQALTGELMSDPLDRNRPLWRFYLIENVNGGCAVLGRIHHCIADGIALIRVLLSLTDAAPDTTEITASVEPEESSPRRNGLFTMPLRLAARVADRGLRMADSLLNETFDLRAGVDSALQSLESAGLLTATSAAIVAKLLVLSPDRPSPYRGQMGGIKRVAWSIPLSLPEVKEVSRAMGVTINDVLVTVMSGALRRDMQERGAATDLGDLRAMVPMNLRQPNARLTLGNEFSLLFLDLPVSLAEPDDRLAAVRRQMQLFKHSPEPYLIYQILSLVGRLPGEVAHLTVNWFADKASFVLTNVPGPRRPLYFAGSQVQRLLFWVPHSGEISMGISIFSYAGTVTLGIDTDEALIPDPGRVVQHFYAEFEELKRIVNRRTATPPPAAYIDHGIDHGPSL